MVLSVEGLSVPLVGTLFGPLPRFSDPDLQALEFAVQWAVEGRIPDFQSQVEQRELVGQFPLVARPAGPEDDLAALGERWRRLTGRELGDDVYVIHTSLGLPEVAIPRQALLELIGRVEELRQASPKPPPPWLFREVPIWHAPASGEEAALRLLERQAEELEAIAKGPPTAEARAREAAKRRFLLVELEARGILSESGYDDKEHWLQAWGLPLTLGYLRAARSLHSHFVSPGRRRYFPDAKDERMVGARVSLDWFRHAVTAPPGRDPDEWLGFCERSLAEAEVSGHEGTLLVREGGPWFEIGWRRDDGEHPAVVAARIRG